MANMIEQSLLCKVLDAPDLEILHSNGVIEEINSCYYLLGKR